MEPAQGLDVCVQRAALIRRRAPVLDAEEIVVQPHDTSIIMASACGHAEPRPSNAEAKHQR
jgi:hypothetical protein